MKKTNTARKINRFSAILLAVVLVLTMLLSGCGSAQDPSVPNATEKYGSDTMKLYIPGEYLGQNVISNFEKQFGVNVIVEYFDSNEMMYTKLQAGDAYDVLVPSDYMIERLIKSDMLQPLNLEKIPNKEQLAEQVKNLPFDPENAYSIPYFWGSVGLVYNEKNVDAKDVEEQGWNVLKNPKYAGRIYVYDSERDAFLMPFKALGYSANTDNDVTFFEFLARHYLAAHVLTAKAEVCVKVCGERTLGERLLDRIACERVRSFAAHNERLAAAKTNDLLCHT